MKGSIIARCENALGRVDPATMGQVSRFSS